MKNILAISVLTLLMSAILMIGITPLVKFSPSWLIYLTVAVFTLSVLLTAGIAIVYCAFRVKYNLYKRQPEMACSSSGHTIDLKKALAESKYVALAFVVSAVASLLNLYQLI